MASAPSKSIVSPENQNVTFVELFFDLVFVFSVTQVVSLLHHGLELQTIGEAILVFWLVWWAWTQFTWALNAADTTHALVEIGALLATVVAFLMTVALPDAFHGRGLWFGTPYVILRGLGLALYIWVASENPGQRAAVRNFALLSVGGLATVLIGGFLGGTAQYVFWGITIVLDIVAAAIGGQSEHWNLHPDHFTERHGLFVIIALGETLIIAAGGISGVEWTPDVIAVAILAVALACGLWWSYFRRAKPILDHALESVQGALRSTMARDAYSLLHFPMLCGMIAYAVAIEEAVAHPGEPLHVEVRLLLAVGLALFVGGLALAIWRATRRLLLPRVILAIGTAAAIVAISEVAPWLSLAITFVGLTAVLILEERTISPIAESHPAE